MFRRTLLCLAVLWPASFPSTAQPLEDRIWLPAQSRFSTPDEVIRLAASADFVLLGETHDNPHHHRLQALVLTRLLQSGRPTQVVFEMLDEGQRPALEAFLQGPSKDADKLAEAVEWARSNWPDWGMYRPLFQAALNHGAPIAPANLSGEEIQSMRKGGQPRALPLPVLPPQAQGRMEQEIQDGHCGMLPSTALPGMVRIQRTRDAIMAHAMIKGTESQDMAVLIAGAGHVRTDLGVPVWLREQRPGRKTFVVMFREVGTETQAALAGDLPADAIWFTQAVQREDPCAAFQRHMGRKTGD